MKVIKKIKNILSANSEFKQTEEFTQFFYLIENSYDNFFITGKAGTGKSTFIEYFRNRSTKNIAVLAPTGLSAINVKGQTIHSFFRFPPHFITKDSIAKNIRSLIYKELDTIIIDEISMVRADVLDGIDLFLRKYGKDKELSFGGIQMIFIGDLFQLSPVLKREEMQVFSEAYESPYFFSSKAFKDGMFKVANFSKIFRQSDENFVEILNNIRNGSRDSSVYNLINQRVVSKDKIDRKKYITLTTTNSVANAINYSELNKINKPLFVFKAEIEGDFPTEDRSLPVDLELNIKEGAKVMFVKNDKAKRFVNGTLGVIDSVTKEEIRVKLDGLNKVVIVNIEEWDNIKYSFDQEKSEIIATSVGVLKQFPLKLAWAITTHKSQGMTFDKVAIDFSVSPFTHGQTYVALSRCRSLEGISLTRKIYPNDVIVNEEILNFKL
ncbi:MAG TPA: AAA family ATPase [Patescibacteria group bacterium]|nr:AAA family ATPase [Patescibacteria group bacterium]